MQLHKEEFENEARLAALQANIEWQEVMTKRMNQSSDSNTASYTQAHQSLPSPLRVISTLPFPRNLMFAGREAIFDEINQLLRPDVDSADAQYSAALLGMGGVGKTQVALEYAYRYKANYSHLFWIKSETELDIRQSFSAMARELDMPSAGAVEQKDVEAVRAWLETSSCTFLPRQEPSTGVDD